MTANRNAAADILCIVGMIVAWTSYYLASDWAVEFTGSAFAAGMLLRAGALVFLTAYMLVRGKFAAVFRQGKTALVLIVIGVLGYMLDTFANLGFRYGSVGTGTVLLKTDILMANVVAAVLFREKLYTSDWLATAVMLGGVVMVLDIDFATAAFNWYDLFFIASAASVTANAFVIKGAQDRLGADSDIIGYYNNFVVLVLFTVSALAAGDFRTLGGLHFEVWHIFALLGGGLAQTGGYICGKERYIDLIGKRLTAPSIGTEVGSPALGYQYYYQGFFMAPHTVAQALKCSLLIGEAMAGLGYKNYPATDKVPHDITRAIEFGDAGKMVDFIREVQYASPVDGYVTCEPWDMPGYDDKIIMAAGTFVSGASIELSADGPVKPPYIAYFQGGLTYEHGKYALLKILDKLV